MSKTPTTEQVTIKLSQIQIPETNMRSEMPRIKELAADLKARGQLAPVIVSNGGPEGTPYILRAGFRRVAAFKLNGWDNREILAVVREYKDDDLIGPIADMWAENIEREQLIPMDLAECIHQLATGTYPVPDGVEAVPIDREVIAARFNLSQDQVSRHIKIFKNTDPDVAHKAKRVEAPLRLLTSIAQIKGEGEDKAAQEEDKAKKQSAILEQYVSHRESLESQGRKRNERADKGTSKKRSASLAEPDDERAPWGVNPSKKVGRADQAIHRSIADYIRVLEGKKGARFAGMLEALRFVTGAVVRLEDVHVADFKALDAEDEREAWRQAEAEGE